MLADAEPGRYVSHLAASLSDLPDHFGLELLGVSLLAHDASQLSLSLEAQRCLETPGLLRESLNQP